MWSEGDGGRGGGWEVGGFSICKIAMIKNGLYYSYIIEINRGANPKRKTHARFLLDCGSNIVFFVAAVVLLRQGEGISYVSGRQTFFQLSTRKQEKSAVFTRSFEMQRKKSLKSVARRRG